MIWEVALVMNDTRVQSKAFIYLNHIPTWDVFTFYHCQVENPLLEVGYKLGFHDFLPCSMLIIDYYYHMGYLLALNNLYDV